MLMNSNGEQGRGLIKPMTTEAGICPKRLDCHLIINYSSGQGQIPEMVQSIQVNIFALPAG